MDPVIAAAVGFVIGLLAGCALTMRILTWRSLHGSWAKRRLDRIGGKE